VIGEWPSADVDLRLQDFDRGIMLWHARWESAYALMAIRLELGLPALARETLIPPVTF
jgi:hypothetical protein